MSEKESIKDRKNGKDEEKERSRKIVSRLEKLREVMAGAGVDYYMIPTADYHDSEYAAAYFAERRYFSGFTGSAGTLLVSRDWAGLWTDGRYWIQAEREMKGTGIQLMKMSEPGVPEIPDFLEQNMKEGQVLGFDGRCVCYKEGHDLKKRLEAHDLGMKTGKDLGERVWKNRPAMPEHPLFILGDEYAGESAVSKIRRLREKIHASGAENTVITRLDDIMWLTNLRGGDVDFNPVALSYLLVTQSEVHFFVQTGEVTGEVQKYCDSCGIQIHPYGEFEDFLRNFSFVGGVSMDPAEVSYRIYQIVKKNCRLAAIPVVQEPCPVELMKAVKNSTELKNVREIYLEDSVKVTDFIFWLTHRADLSKETELSAAEYLDNLRRDIPGYLEPSFATIAAYGANAAQMHYDPAKQTPAPLAPEGMLLVDSGGTYLRGTTDVTRTTALGPVTDDMRKSYTLTAAGNLNLLHAVFLDGCKGVNLDILCREPLWETGTDYKCGTGHGIGYCLNVHEGPQSIRWRQSRNLTDAVFEPGMIISDEPGVYKAGAYGIRIETILLCTEAVTTPDGRFLTFEPLTFVPLDRSLIDPQYLTDKERTRLNEYHRQCREKLLPWISDEEERNWLLETTAEL